MPPEYLWGCFWVGWLVLGICMGRWVYEEPGQSPDEQAAVLFWCFLAIVAAPLFFLAFLISVKNNPKG